MKNKYIISSAVIILLSAFFIDSAHARFPSRGAQAARMTRSAISRALDLRIRPTLNFEKIIAGPVSSLALSADEHYLVTVIGKNKLRLWDLNAGREVAVSSAAQGDIINVEISPDSTLCFYTCSDGSVHSWNLKTLESKVYKSCPPSNLIAFHKDGRVAVGGLKGELSQFNPADSKNISIHKIGDSPFQAIEINEAGQVLLATGKSIYIVDKASSNVVDKISTGTTPTAIACDGNTLIWGTKKGQLVVWNLKTNSQANIYKKINGTITSIDINSKSRKTVCGTEDGRLYSVNLKNGKTEEIGGHSKKITFVRMDNIAENALTASEDGTCKLWNLKSKQLQLTMVSAVDGWAVVDSKGRFDGTQAALEGVEWQDGEHVININKFSQVYYEPNLLPRVMGGKSSELKDVDTVSEGIHLAANVEINGKARGGQDAIIRVVGSDQQGSGIRDVKLYQNGKRVSDGKGKTTTKETEDGKKELISEYNVTLGSGENVFSAVAVNDEQLESDPAEIVIKSGRPEAKRNIWIVTIGVNKYAIADLNLDYARPDAQSLYKYFDENTQLMVNKKKLLALYDEKASSQSINKIFNTLQYIPRDDLVVIYMAGHGIIVDDEWYFLPSNINAASEEQVLKNGISTKELKQHVESVGADRVVLFLDACQSGGALSPIKNFKGIKSLRMLARDVGVHILAATDREQFAVELESLGHGVFTYSLLHALDGKNIKSKTDDQIITIREIMTAVEREVPALSKKFANYAQFPVSHSRGNDFNLLKK
ncbi:caspase family protein [Maridesulfovibrio sp.]|uniref:caspase family protein n=1 Tax=Maridesulfovibrio sp. TaxID=2795000 RepID=UPI0039EE117A